ncbi:hypothetical protein M8494_06770 [Serratia ureilytica]
MKTGTSVAINTGTVKADTKDITGYEKVGDDVFAINTDGDYYKATFDKATGDLKSVGTKEATKPTGGTAVPALRRSGSYWP